MQEPINVVEECLDGQEVNVNSEMEGDTRPFQDEPSNPMCQQVTEVSVQVIMVG